MADEATRLVDEAMKKAAVAWVAVDDGQAQGLWCLPLEGALYVVSGPGEQPAADLVAAARAGATEPKLAGGTARVTVTLRGDHGGRIVTWPADATRLDPAGEAWTIVVPQLAAKRLNASGTADTVIARWAAECAVIRLAPASEPTEAGPTLPDSSLAAVPRPTPAANQTAKPFRLHRVRRRG
jgi:hypothetical protein